MNVVKTKKKINSILLAIGFIFGTAYLYAQEVAVFESGQDGYESYRIPAIVKNKNGDLIAFAEGRVDGAGDFGNINIVYKISKDNGKCWGDRKSTRLNSSHVSISYAVLCLKKKKIR